MKLKFSHKKKLDEETKKARHISKKVQWELWELDRDRELELDRSKSRFASRLTALNNKRISGPLLVR